jgi:hypothetical protein
LLLCVVVVVAIAPSLKFVARPPGAGRLFGNGSRDVDGKSNLRLAIVEICLFGTRQ